MVFQTPEGMDEFITSTRLCDVEHARVKNRARELTENANSPEEAALSIFTFVRDSILFGLDFPDTRASETLERGYGFCVTKTNLQIALLRSVGIPARFHRVDIRKDILKGTFPALSYHTAGKSINDSAGYNVAIRLDITVYGAI